MAVTRKRTTRPRRSAGLALAPASRPARFAAGPDALLARVRAVALRRLGLLALRPAQEEAIVSVLQGRDTLAVLPTGSGKSAIYQAAALLLEGPTVVISPLIAGLEDLGVVGRQASGEVEVIESEAEPAPLAEEAARQREKRREQDADRVESMRGYAETAGCRRAYVLDYFGEPTAEGCGFCDNCDRQSALAPRLRPPKPA